MFIVWILIGLAALVGIVFFIRLVTDLGGQAGMIDDDRQPPCKETCDIHGKVGDPIRYDCGHDDAPEFRIDLWGEPKFHKKPEYGTLLCSDCMLKEVLAASLRCGSCGYAIMPGDQISLCVDDGNGKEAWRTVFDGNLALCLRWACDAGPGYCGTWTGKGIRPAFPDGRNMISHAYESVKPVIVNDGVVEEEEGT